MLFGYFLVVFTDHIHKSADRERADRKIVIFTLPFLQRGAHTDRKLDNTHTEGARNDVVTEFVNKNKQTENENGYGKAYKRLKH